MAETCKFSGQFGNLEFRRTILGRAFGVPFRKDINLSSDSAGTLANGVTRIFFFLTEVFGQRLRRTFPECYGILVGTCGASGEETLD